MYSKIIDWIIKNNKFLIYEPRQKLSPHHELHQHKTFDKKHNFDQNLH